MNLCKQQNMSVPVNDIASGLNSAAIHLIRRLRQQDSKLKVGPARLSALSVLVFGGACSLSELAAYEQVTSATMSRIVSGMEQNGLAKRKQASNDARALQIVATAKGKKLMLRGQKARVESLAAELENLDQKELDCLRNAVQILRKLDPKGS